MLERNIDDFWKVDGDRDLSDTWTGFTRFATLSESHRMDIHGPGRRLTRKQTTSRPDKLWPEMWKHTSDAAKSKAKQKWTVEKSKLDNVRQLHGIFFIAPDDEEFGHTMKNARRKLEIPMPAAGKPAALMENTRKNTLVLLMLTNS